VAGLGSDGAGTRDDGSSPGQRPSIESFVGRLTIDVELELDTPGRLPFPSEQDDTAAANGKSHGTSRGSSSLLFFVTFVCSCPRCPLPANGERSLMAEEAIDPQHAFGVGR